MVIFHVDDAGMCYDANLGTIEAIENGVATSMSIMMPCPKAAEMVQYAIAHPDMDAGIHLTMNAEWAGYRWGPVADKALVPGLVDAEGFLWPGVHSTALHARADEVETEIRAQLDRALAMGLEPTHLDTHMGTVFFPTFLRRYVKVGIEKDIPIMLPAGHLDRITRGLAQEVGKLDAKPGLGAVIANALAHQSYVLLTARVRRYGRQLWDAGLPVIDDLEANTSSWGDFEHKKATLILALRTLEPGITQFIFHCTRPETDFKQISGSWPSRLSDLQVMTDPEVRCVIDEEGIVLTTWRELKQRR